MFIFRFIRRIFTLIILIILAIPTYAVAKTYYAAHYPVARAADAIVGAAVEAAKPFGIPVTVKMRIGIDSDHHTYLEAAKSAADLGVTWVALHARTAEQMYEGKSDWSAITRLVDHYRFRFASLL